MSFLLFSLSLFFFCKRFNLDTSIFLLPEIKKNLDGYFSQNQGETLWKAQLPQIIFKISFLTIYNYFLKIFTYICCIFILNLQTPAISLSLYNLYLALHSTVSYFLFYHSVSTSVPKRPHPAPPPNLIMIIVFIKRQ